MNSDEYKELKSDISDLSSKLETNTQMTLQIAKSTSDVVDAFNAARGAFKTLETLGKMSKPFIYIAGLGGVCYGYWVHLKDVLHKWIS